MAWYQSGSPPATLIPMSWGTAPARSSRAAGPSRVLACGGLYKTRGTSPAAGAIRAAGRARPRVGGDARDRAGPRPGRPADPVQAEPGAHVARPELERQDGRGRVLGHDGAGHAVLGTCQILEL